MKKSFLSYLILSALATTTVVAAEDLRPKSSLKSNGQLIYHATQKKVDAFSEMFQEGEFYGRLRNNNFYFNYNIDDPSHNSHLVGAVGASLVYKSAEFSGFDFRLGLYGSHAFFNETNDPINRLKSAKDTLSRYAYVNTRNKSFGVVGQVNTAYRVSKTHFILGRQLLETFYTKSNDTKMVPNAFDAFVLSTQDLPQTTMKLAYLYKQKLRDHLEAHAVLMVGDANSSSMLLPEWSQQDDSAMHKGLTYSALKAAGKPTEAPLIVFDVVNNTVDNLSVNFSSYIVPDLLSQAMGEFNYKMKFDGFSIRPGVRYIQQFDNGAGAVGGASLTGKVNATSPLGYRDPTSLNAKMIAARIVTKVGAYKINLGYTNILDEGDLVTPWRGFPTAGYTRSMGMYNWYANTKSYRLELVKGANKTGVYKDLFIQASVLYIDGDSKKSAFSDSMFYYVGFIQNLSSFPEFQYRLRLGYRDFVGDASSVSSYLDSRLEFNYLF